MRDSECRTVDDLHCDFALLGGEKKALKFAYLILICDLITNSYLRKTEVRLRTQTNERCDRT